MENRCNSSALIAAGTTKDSAAVEPDFKRRTQTPGFREGRAYPLFVSTVSHRRMHCETRRFNRVEAASPVGPADGTRFLPFGKSLSRPSKNAICGVRLHPFRLCVSRRQASRHCTCMYASLLRIHPPCISSFRTGLPAIRLVNGLLKGTPVPVWRTAPPHDPGKQTVVLPLLRPRIEFVAYRSAKCADPP